MTPLDIAFIGTIGTVLLAINAFFIKRLVEKIDKTACEQTKASVKIESIHRSLSGMDAQLSDIRSEIKGFRRLEIDVAILKNQVQPET